VKTGPGPSGGWLRCYEAGKNVNKIGRIAIFTTALSYDLN